MKKILFLDPITPISETVVINKQKPSEILLRIPNDIVLLMRSVYKKYDIKVGYNGNVYYLSPQLLEKINLEPDLIGITTRIIDNDPIFEIPKDVDISNIDCIAVFSDVRISTDNFFKQYERVIDKIYNSFDKVKTITSNLIGYKIIDNTFTDLVCDSYETVYYKEISGIEVQNYIDLIDYKNDLVKNIFIERLKTKTLKINDYTIKLPNIIKYS